MPSKSIQTGYLLGIALLLTSIFYFFTANWQYFDRLVKVALSVALFLFFYGLHFLFRKYNMRLLFISNWLFLAANIVFGISIALIGQIYNSHADSYQLFLIWFIPVFILAIMTKYVPFYILSFILGHVTFYFFLFPTAYFKEWSEHELLLMLFTVVIINAIVFYLCYRPILQSKSIFYGAFMMFHISFFCIILNESLPFHILTNILYIMLLIACFYYWYKVHLHYPLFVITGVFASLYVLYRGVYWIMDHYGEFALFLLLLIAVGLVFNSMLIVGFLRREKLNHFLSQFIMITVTVIATLFATLAIGGLFFLLFPGATAAVLFFFAVIALIAPGLFFDLPEQIKYALLGTGFVLAYTTGLAALSNWYFYLLPILLGIGFYVVKMTGIRVLIYLFMNLTLAYIFVDLFSFHWMYLLLLLLNVGYYGTQKETSAVKHTALIAGYIHFLILTVLHVAPLLQFIYNAVFFLVATGILILIKREKYKWEWTASFVFWFLFLAYTYYEYLWTLIHKSVLFFGIGLLFIVITYYFDKKTVRQEEKQFKIRYQLPLLIGIIILQFGFISYQAVTNEALLKSGTTIKLELEPVDPRSIMQGDYMQLRYEISDLGEENNNTNFHQRKLKVVLREQNGIHRYAGFYKTTDGWNKLYEPKENDVIINGTAYSPYHVTYGIENFFIPEGTGLELERNIKFAYVRVGKSGNAIIEGVE